MGVRYYNNIKHLQFSRLADLNPRNSHRLTGEEMLGLICALTDAVVGESWTDKSVGVASDGAANMVCKISRVVARLIKKGKSNVFGFGRARIN